MEMGCRPGGLVFLGGEAGRWSVGDLPGHHKGLEAATCICSLAR
jgi:hypothetical protein